MAERSTRLISWRRLAVESLAIMASILLAFSVDAWWGQLQDRGREVALLDGLLADFQASRPLLESRVDLARRQARNNALLVDELSAQTQTGSATVADSLVLAVITTPTYEAVTDVLDAALASGTIQLVRSADLRAELASWSRQLVDSGEMELEVRLITNRDVVPAFLRTVSLEAYFNRVLVWSAGDRVTGLPGQVTLTPSPDLVGLLAMRLFHQDTSAQKLDQLLASLDRIVGILERALST